MVGSEKNKIKESIKIVLQALVCLTTTVRTSNRTLRQLWARVSHVVTHDGDMEGNDHEL